MFIKLKEFDKGPLMLGEAAKTHDLWLSIDSITEFHMTDFGRTSLGTKTRWCEVLETPEQIMDLIDPPLTEEEKEAMRKFGIEMDDYDGE